MFVIERQGLYKLDSGSIGHLTNPNMFMWMHIEVVNSFTPSLCTRDCAYMYKTCMADTPNGSANMTAAGFNWWSAM